MVSCLFHYRFSLAASFFVATRTWTMALSNMNNWKGHSPYLAEFGQPPSDDDVRRAGIDGSTPSKDPVIYKASCYCGRVKYEVRGDPESSKLCHCRGCQLLHGAPFEWVSIFLKHNVRFDQNSLKYLYFYSGESDIGFSSVDPGERPALPLKVSCSHCRTPVADEGRNVWLAFSTLFGFTTETGIPESFQHSCHLFYRQRCINLPDDKTKWEGHKNKSGIWQE